MQISLFRFSEPVIEFFLIELVQFVLEIVIKLVYSSCFATFVEFPIIVQEVIVLRELGASLHVEDKAFVLSVFLVDNVVLDEQISEFGFKQVVPLNFPCHVLSELPVGEDQLLNCLLLLTRIDFLHLLTVQGLFELLNTAS